MQLITSLPSGRRTIARYGVALVVALSLLSLITSCGSSTPGSSGPNIVATIAPIADLTQRVAGDRLKVNALVPVGQNSHTYAPRSGDAKMLAEATLFIDNGLGLNKAINQLADENLPDEAKTVRLGEIAVPDSDLIKTESDCHDGHCHGGNTNGHLWPNPKYAGAYVDKIVEALVAADPGGKESFEANAQALKAEIDKLDLAIAKGVDTIKPEDRKLVTYHDAWAYFARRYSLKMVGAVQPLDFSEPSAADVRRMVDQLKREKVPTFFGSEVFPTRVLETIAQEAGAKYYGDLRDDELPGEPGAPEHSYIGMMKINAEAIVRGLGGDPSALKDIDPAVATPRAK